MGERIVVVTGGAQNIGLGIAQAFQASGCTVIAADLKASEHVGNGSAIEFIETDVSSEASVQSLMTAIEQRHGRLDVLVNNAGICIEVALQNMSLEDFQKPCRLMCKAFS